MKRILITGGFGKIGHHFVQNFHQKYNITVADVVTDKQAFPSNVQTIQADLTDWEKCFPLFQEIDTVVHLAGLVDTETESDEVMDTNMLLTKNVFKAALKANCKRVIFASSAQTIESYPTDLQIHKDQVTKPRNLYGVSKCFGEALAAYHAYNNGISAICLRIGAYEFPKDFTEMNARDLSAFLHPDDFNQLLLGCIETNDLQYEVFNAISNNRFKRLDITEAQEKVGYTPQADAFELFSLAMD